MYNQADAVKKYILPTFPRENVYAEVVRIGIIGQVALAAAA